MPAILIYCNRYYNFTGGLEIIMLFLKYLKQQQKVVYLCPILKNIPSLHLITNLHDIQFDILIKKKMIIHGFSVILHNLPMESPQMPSNWIYLRPNHHLDNIEYIRSIRS